MQVLINIDVDDLERAVDFYQAALELKLARTLFDGDVAELRGASSRIYLLKNAEASQATKSGEARRFNRHWTPVHLDFVVDDIEQAVNRANCAGAKQETAVQHFPWGKLATLSDPFGNGFCLVQFPAEPYEGQDANDPES